MHKKILLLGSGELGKEVVIALQRYGQTVVAVDAYAGAPAMQVADACEVINMLDGKALDAGLQWEVFSSEGRGPDMEERINGFMKK